MKKKFIKILSYICVVTIMFTTVACGKEKVVNDENTLIIEMINAGYGRRFVDDIAKEFENRNPGKSVHVEATPFFGSIDASLRGGPDITTTDLFIAVIDPFKMVTDGKAFGNDCLLEDLTSVYDEVIDGENKSIKDKIDSDYYEYMTINNKIYTMPWANPFQGLIYNKGEFISNGYEVPRTTNELLDLAEEIKNNGKKAFIFAGLNDFYKFTLFTWWAQYEGRDSFDRFFEGKNDAGEYDKGVFAQDGRLEALKVIDEMLNENNGYCPKDCIGYDFTTAQYNFVKGNALMMSNGDWIENELRNSSAPGSVNLEFMKMPIISSLGTKLGITEEQLIQVIDYVDGIGQTKPLVSDEIIDEIRETRSYVNVGSVSHNAFIPSYSNAKPLAKEFLKFMLSDEGHKIYINSTSGASLPIEFDFESNSEIYNNLTTLQKSKIAIMKDSIKIIEGKKSPLVYRGGLKPFLKGNIEPLLGARYNERMTAQQIYNYDIEYYTNIAFEDLLTKSGV